MSDVEKLSPAADEAELFRVLVVDDDIPICKLLRSFLEKLDVRVDTATNGEQAMRLVSPGSHDLILLDLMMPEKDGLQTLRAVRRLDIDVPVLVMTGYGTIERAVAAMKCGANEFLLKPLSLADLREQIARERTRRMHFGRRLLEGTSGELPAAAFRIITCDIEMLRLLKLVEKVAPLPSTVLIQGESGTGKELVARAVHYAGGRSGESFVAMNCGAIPDQLLESELFGYEKGAFTGAATRRIGFFEAAGDGTIYLDEISEMSLELQVKLLRVIQERSFRRLGSTAEIATSARIVASSNRDLEVEVAKGRFREDLYYRVNVIKLEVPPLRERPDDIPLLSRYFAAKYAQEFHKEIEGIEESAMAILKTHPWKGNVRELQNVIERATAVAEAEWIAPADLPSDVASTGTVQNRIDALDSFDDAREKFEREYLSRVMERSRGNVSLAARLTNIARQNLYEKLKKHGIEADDFRPD